MDSQESGSSSLEKSAMLEESQSAMSLQNIASETSSTMQETMVMTSMQETKVTQEMHQEMQQEVHQKVHQEMHREMLLSEEVEEMHVSSEERQETSWASSQSESSTCERSQTSSSMSLTERFAADSQQRYASTQETLRIPQEVETKKKEEAKVESGCILGKHMKVIKAAMEELEMGEKKLEEQLDPSDTEHLHRRRQMSEQPSVISLDTTTTISATNTGKESDEETVMTTTTLKDTTEWESTTCKETDDGDTTAKETEDEGEEETEDEETISMRKKFGAVFLTECSSSQVSLLKIFILVQILATILLLPLG